MKSLPNIHPGEILLEEFLAPMGISQNRLARAMGVPPRRINEIVHGKRSVTADTALRLARYFGTTEAFWMGLQADFDLEEARPVAPMKMVPLVESDEEFYPGQLRVEHGEDTPIGWGPATALETSHSNHQKAN